jgi:tetratricopeptide (TPR) repeat protein
MKSIILLLALSLACSSLFAQADSTQFFLQKGLTEKKNGRRMESLKNFERALKYDANNKTVLTELASAYLDLRKYYEARDTYKKLIDIGDKSAENYKQLLQLSFNLRRYDDVVNYANNLKKTDPSAKVCYYLGKVYFEQEDYGNAIKNLTTATTEDPGNADVQFMLGRCYMNMQNYKQAVPFYEKAIQMDSTKTEWMFELGIMCNAMYDNKNSLKYILLAGEKGYRKDNIYLENLGIAYLEDGQFELGISTLTDLLKRRPSDINILYMIAEAYYDKKNYDQAINYWDMVLQNDKNHAKSLYMIGICFQKKGDKSKGQGLCDRAIQMDPSLAALKSKQMGSF